MTLKITTAAILGLVLITSCAEEPKAPAPKTNDNALIIGDPLDCGLDSLTVFPVGCSYNPQIIEGEVELDEALGNAQLTNQAASKIKFSANTSYDAKYDRSATVEYINDNDNDFDIRNLVFYNLLSGESYPLVNDSIHILSFALHKEFELPLIFYRVVKEDYNEDEKFNSFDPVMLYVSNLDGSDFKQITPEDEYFIDYTLYKQTNSILIKTAIDSNKDKKYLVDDETNFRSMQLSEPKFAENIFNSAIKDTLRKYN